MKWLPFFFVSKIRRESLCNRTRWWASPRCIQVNSSEIMINDLVLYIRNQPLVDISLRIPCGHVGFAIYINMTRFLDHNFTICFTSFGNCRVRACPISFCHKWYSNFPRFILIFVFKSNEIVFFIREQLQAHVLFCYIF